MKQAAISSTDQGGGKRRGVGIGNFVAALFGLVGAGLLLMPNQWLALAWWVMAAGFAIGQFWIARLIALETETETEMLSETSS